MRTWTLPEHIEDLLPADAKKLERLRRVALDLFATHGFNVSYQDGACSLGLLDRYLNLAAPSDWLHDAGVLAISETVTA